MRLLCGNPECALRDWEVDAPDPYFHCLLCEVELTVAVDADATGPVEDSDVR